MSAGSSRELLGLDDENGASPEMGAIHGCGFPLPRR
jgi:hypothetical protein